MDDNRPRMTTAEAAAYLNCAESSLKSGRSRGRGPTFYRGIGREILYRRADLDAFIESCRVAPAGRTGGQNRRHRDQNQE